MQEGPDQSLSISERLNRLIAYDNARNTLSWQKLDPIRLPPSLESGITPNAGHLVSYTARTVMVYRPPSRFRGIVERTWRYEFDFPRYEIFWAGVEPSEDLLILEIRSVGPELRRSVV